MCTHPGSLVGWPVRHKTTHLLLTTRLQLRWRSPHVRFRPLTASPPAYMVRNAYERAQKFDVDAHPQSQVGGDGPSSAWLRTSSSRHDSNCVGDPPTCVVAHSPPHRPPRWYETPVSAPKGPISMCSHPGSWVRRPNRHKNTHLLLTTRLQLRWRSPHERIPPHTATTAPRWY